LLSDWFSRPHVGPWWREAYDLGSIEENYGPSVDGLDPTELFVMDTGGSPIGLSSVTCSTRTRAGRPPWRQQESTRKPWASIT
jgi:hypothetical protein